VTGTVLEGANYQEGFVIKYTNAVCTPHLVLTVLDMSDDCL